MQEKLGVRLCHVTEAGRGVGISRRQGCIHPTLADPASPGHTAASVDVSPGSDPVSHQISGPGPPASGRGSPALTTSYGPWVGPLPRVSPSLLT